MPQMLVLVSKVYWNAAKLICYCIVYGSFRATVTKLWQKPYDCKIEPKALKKRSATSELQNILYCILSFPFIAKISQLRFSRMEKGKLIELTIQNDMCLAFLLTTVLFGCHFSIMYVCFILQLGFLLPLLLVNFSGCFSSPYFYLFHLSPFHFLFSLVLLMFFTYSRFGESTRNFDHPASILYII